MLFTAGLHYNNYRVCLSFKWLLVRRMAVFRGTRLISDNRSTRIAHAILLAGLLAYVTSSLVCLAIEMGFMSLAR